MCDYIITQFYNNNSFDYPEEILRRCHYIYTFKLLHFCDIGDGLKTYTNGLWEDIIKKL